MSDTPDDLVESISDAELIEQQAARIAKLEARLEIDHAFRWNPDAADETERFEIPPSERDDFPDGISCRDATIGLLEDRIAALEAENARLREALEFYADPDTYFAIGFFPDDPCGDFRTDFENISGDPTARPGRRARAALKPAEEPAEC